MQDEWRAYIGRFGITGKLQTQRIGQLSDGQKSRLVFGMLCMKNHNMLLLDEPTNHLVSGCGFTPCSGHSSSASMLSWLVVQDDDACLGKQAMSSLSLELAVLLRPFAIALCVS